MYIQKIKITNFKSIYEPLELDFSNMVGLWKISGSVGAGKTTIGEAIIYGLFGAVSGKNNNDLISWGRKHGLIEIWCTSKDRAIYIKRELNLYGQSPIYVEIDGKELIFTNKRDAQAQLEHEYYDTSRVTLELLCIISFNNFKSLATLNTNDTKKFLDQVLGFYILTQYADICKELKTANFSNVISAENNIINLKSQISKLEEISNMDKIEGNIDEILEQYNLFTNQLTDITNEMQKKLDEISVAKKDYENQLTSVITLGKHKAKEIKFIEQGTCPTCGAKIDQSQLEVKRKEKEVLMNQYKLLNEKINEQKNIFDKIVKEYENKQDPIKQKLEELINLKYKLEEQAKRININTQEIDNINNLINQTNDELLSYKLEEAEWDSLYKILSISARTHILESFIPILNKNILTYTQTLHLPYIIEFDSMFKCNVSICGLEQPISISSLSTGQLKIVDMIIILGVLGTVMGSNNLNIMFLDELFSNLDADLRFEMCTLLKKFIKPNNTMFIISHQEIDDSFFNGVVHMKLELKNRFEKHSITTISKK